MPDNSGGSSPSEPVRYIAAGVLAALLVVALYLGYQKGYLTLPGEPAGNKPAAPPVATDTAALRQTSDSFRSVAKRVGPAVVNVKATHIPQKGAGRRGGSRPPDDYDNEGSGDPFEDFFRQFMPGGPFQRPQPEGPQMSLGSGILIDKQGIVVTNNHVVEDATEIVVNLPDDTKDLKVKVIGTDAKSDLAVLKLLTGNDYPTADWANSDEVEVGDWAIAIGSPFALGSTVTVGIVSAKGRSAQGVTGSEYGGELIQTDAAINPGNSGGPLCDVDGRVMGVNTAIYTRNGGYMGIGFAIPANQAKEVVGNLIKQGKVIRGWLGVYIQPLDTDLAADLGVKKGISIHEVVDGSPAAKAGLKAGDVIVEVDGKPVGDVEELQRNISKYRPGQVVKLKVVSYNNRKSRTVKAVIGTLPDQETETKETAPADEPDKLGLVVGPIHGRSGVVVEVVQPGSFADQALGLEAGDVLLRINRKSIDSVVTYQKLMTSNRQIALEVKRNGRTLFFRFARPD